MDIRILDLSDNDIVSFSTKEVPLVGDYVRFDGIKEGNKLRVVKSREFSFAHNELWHITLTVDAF